MAEWGQEKGEDRSKSDTFAYPFLSARVGHGDEDHFEKDKVHNDLTWRAAGLQEKGGKGHSRDDPEDSLAIDRVR
jgi:hypothetical protein